MPDKAKDAMATISIVVPCLNEAEALPFFHDSMQGVLATLSDDVTWELIYIDDGSSDDTLETIRIFSQQDARVRFLSFSRNFGKEAACYAGLQASGGDYVVILDADLQDPPALIPQMYRMLCSDATLDCVTARRISRKGEPWVRSAGARFFYWLMSRISDTPLIEGVRDYRMMTRRMVNAILELSERNRFSKGMFSWVGFKTGQIEYEHFDRIAGKTTWSIWGLLAYSIEGIVNHSTVPLSFASWVGLLLFILSLIGALFIVVRTLVFGNPVAGWSSLACLILFIGGVQLFSIGIMGQYLLRIYIETKERPLFIIAQRSEDSSLSPDEDTR